MGLAMNLRNYTSTVPVGRTVADIEELLVKAGATTVSRFYDDKQRLAGFLFQMNVVTAPNTRPIPVTFKLPANPSAVEKVMKSGVKRAHKGTYDRIADQAERTAWRLLYDWVSVQVSMILLEQAKAIQVFLPYYYDTRTDRTLFEHLEEGNFKLLTQGTKE